MNKDDQIVEARDFGDQPVDIVYTRARPADRSGGKFPPLEPGTSVVDGIRLDRDVPVVLRDGITVYTDVYRPDGDGAVPAIVAWSPYGKRSGYVGMNQVQGVPAGTYSEGTKAEGPDPEFWVHRGYAVVNPDARGAGYSEGHIEQWSSAEGRDAADLVDWVGEQPWCTGRVGMAGSSWLAISQWFAAAERPKHLAAIAPWEGLTDLYRQLLVRGGIPEVGFNGFLQQEMTGPGYFEDTLEMATRHPFFDAYWADKVPVLERIEIPVYITAGWSHFHLQGSLEAFNRLGSTQKWLRAHRDFEWPDFYRPENLADLDRFFERFLKLRRNGWEMTPHVRLDVMDRGDRDHVVSRAERTFPLPDTEYRRYELDAATGSLVSSIPAEASVAYDAAAGEMRFDLRFDSDTEVTGYPKLKLEVEARGNDDADLFVVLQKLGEDGEVVSTLVMGLPHPGSPGMLRVSHRELDEEASSPSQPVHRHAREQRLAPGQRVPVEIAIWPMSRFWHAGEWLRITISGHYVRDDGWFEPFAWDVRNVGEHVLHTGGDTDAHLLLPVTPARRRVDRGEPLPPLEAAPDLGDPA